MHKSSLPCVSVHLPLGMSHWQLGSHSSQGLCVCALGAAPGTTLPWDLRAVPGTLSPSSLGLWSSSPCPCPPSPAAPFPSSLCFWVFFKTESPCVAQTGLEATIHLPLSSESWDYTPTSWLLWCLIFIIYLVIICVWPHACHSMCV